MCNPSVKMLMPYVKFFLLFPFELVFRVVTNYNVHWILMTFPDSNCDVVTELSKLVCTLDSDKILIKFCSYQFIILFWFFYLVLWNVEKINVYQNLIKMIACSCGEIFQCDRNTEQYVICQHTIGETWKIELPFNWHVTYRPMF